MSAGRAEQTDAFLAISVVYDIKDNNLRVKGSKGLQFLHTPTAQTAIREGIAEFNAKIIKTAAEIKRKTESAKEKIAKEAKEAKVQAAKAAKAAKAQAAKAAKATILESKYSEIEAGLEKMLNLNNPSMEKWQLQRDTPLNKGKAILTISFDISKFYDMMIAPVPESPALLSPVIPALLSPVIPALLSPVSP